MRCVYSLKHINAYLCSPIITGVNLRASTAIVLIVTLLAELGG